MTVETQADGGLWHSTFLGGPSLKGVGGRGEKALLLYTRYCGASCGGSHLLKDWVERMKWDCQRDPDKPLEMEASAKMSAFLESWGVG